MVFDIETRLNFGFYRGLDLGTVYVFDPGYIEWCINNIPSFSVYCIEELQTISVFIKELYWEYKATGTHNANMFIYNSYRELIYNIDPGERKFIFNDNTIEINNWKNEKNNNLREHTKFPTAKKRSELIEYTSFEEQILEPVEKFKTNNDRCRILEPEFMDKTLIVFKGNEKKYVVFLGDLNYAAERAGIEIYRKENQDAYIKKIKCSCNNGILSVIDACI
jgi:hypothetical protein